ncbi:hypothetical protein SHIRM173S_04586 [Streptomyces hirsutus]
MTTPPPQGNPFAQGQQQPQGQNPFTQGQPGFPQQAGQPGFPPQGAPVPPEQPRRKIGFKTIKNIAIAVVVAGVAIGGFIASRDDANTAAVGDCMHRGSTSDNDPDLEVVDCNSSDAQYEVLAKDRRLVPLRHSGFQQVRGRGQGIPVRVHPEWRRQGLPALPEGPQEVRQDARRGGVSRETPPLRAS